MCTRTTSRKTIEFPADQDITNSVPFIFSDHPISSSFIARPFTCNCPVP